MKAPAAGHTRLIIVGATGRLGDTPFALRFCSVTAIGRKRVTAQFAGFVASGANALR